MPKIWFPILAALLLVSSHASAHKIIMAVYESGNVLEGELGFSSGDMAIGQHIDVFDGDGNKLGETKTDEDGFFTFQPTQAVTHIFRANLGAGHVGEAIIMAEDLVSMSGLTPNTVSTSPGATPNAAVQATASSNATVDHAVLAKAIRDELRPLRRELAAYKEKNDLQSILGGIGYIIGIFGVGMYVAARKKLKEASS